MTYFPEPKKLAGFQTSDGKIHENISDARKHENTISMLEWLYNNRSIDTEPNYMLDWLTQHGERIEEYYYCYEGADPARMNERD